MRNKAKKMLSCVLALALAVSMNSVSGVILPGTHAVLADEVVQGTPYALVDGELKYDVTVDHVIINQVFGANKSSSTSHGFIELYNPTNKDVDLSNWSVQYKSSEEGGDNEEWLKCDLEGTIKAHSSYLIRGREHNPDTPDLWVAEGDIEWDIKMHTKGISVVLLSNQELLDAEAMPFNNETKAPNVDGYVDMIGVNGNDVGTDPEYDIQKVPNYEGAVSNVQSKKKGVRRINFTDTDNNSAEDGDLQMIDYFEATEDYIEEYKPKNSASGKWGYVDTTGIPYVYENSLLRYDVSVKHIVINQVCGASGSSSTSHGFIELYNPTEDDVDLTDWSVQYKSSPDGENGDAWVKCDLEGSIAAHSSYLIRCQEGNPEANLIVAEGDVEWDMPIHTKGVSVVLLNTQQLLEADSVPFDNEAKAPAVDGYVDMVAMNGNDSEEVQKAPAFENAASDIQSKKKGVRRVKFADTDNNSTEDGDLEVVNYDTDDAEYIENNHPRNSAEGTWGEDDNQEETTTEESVTDETTTDETTTTEITTSGETTTVADIPETTSKQDVTTTAPVKVKAPAKAKIAKVNTKKLAATSAKLSLKKVKGAKGYQVAVYKTKKLANKNKKALVKKFVKKIKVTVKSKKLKNKKTLFVKARAYVLSGSNKVYGKWSKVKKIKIK